MNMTITRRRRFLNAFKNSSQCPVLVDSLMALNLFCGAEKQEIVGLFCYGFRISEETGKFWKPCKKSWPTLDSVGQGQKVEKNSDPISLKSAQQIFSRWKQSRERKREREGSEFMCVYAFVRVGVWVWVCSYVVVFVCECVCVHVWVWECASVCVTCDWEKVKQREHIQKRICSCVHVWAREKWNSSNTSEKIFMFVNTVKRDWDCASASICESVANIIRSITVTVNSEEKKKCVR